MLCIVQARLSSKRLPGKMLKETRGQPLLGWVLSRLSQARSLSQIVVATSDDPTDQPLAEFCQRQKIACFRGPLEDVVARFVGVVQAQQAPAFVRVCGDSPLIDPALIDRAVGYFQQAECDLVTNVFPRSFPKGQSVEVLLSATFLKTAELLTTPEQREHITQYYYQNSASYRLLNFTSGYPWGECNLSVDTLEDFIRFQQMLERFGGKGDWETLAKFYQTLGS